MNTEFLIIPRSEFDALKAELKSRDERILQAIEGNATSSLKSGYLTVKEFMTWVKIARSKFDELVSEGKIKTVRPNGGRKIYIPESEVTRYFEGE